MRLLLDTHAVVWSADDPAKLSAAAPAAILNPGNDRVLSAAVMWEMPIKVGLGKLTLSLPFRPWIEKAVAA